MDWRQWLDVVDEAGLVPAGVADLTFAEDLLVDTGVVKQGAVRGRADARAAFHELQALAPSGVTPVVVRRALDTWDFDVATREMRLARQIAERLAATPKDTRAGGPVGRLRDGGLTTGAPAPARPAALRPIGPGGQAVEPEPIAAPGTGVTQMGAATTWSPWVRILVDRMPSSSMDSTSM